MNIKRITLRKKAGQSARGWRLASLAAALAVTAGMVLVGSPRLWATTGGTLYISPASGSYSVGNQFSVALRENSGSTSVNGVQATITFPSSLLQLVSADNSGAFTVNPPDTTGSGSIELTRGAYSGQTGDQLVSNLTFKVLTTGTAAVNIDTGSSYVAATSDGSHTPLSFTNGSYALANSPSPPSNTNTSPPPPGNTTTGTGNTTNTGSSSGSTSTKKGSVTATPQGVSTPVTLVGNSTAQVSSPVTVQPTDMSEGKVQKVVYYLNGKQVDVETTPPYKYRIDTTKLHNGDYTLVSKTYYTNGKVSQTKQTLHVKNAANHQSLWLLLGLLLAIFFIGGGSFTLRRRFHRPAPPAGEAGLQPPFPAAPVSPLEAAAPMPAPAVTPIPVSTVPAEQAPAPAVTPAVPADQQLAPIPAPPENPAPAPVAVAPPAPPVSIDNVPAPPIPVPGTITSPTAPAQIE